MSELLFDTPWWLPGLVGAVGVILFVTGNKRAENNIRNAGAAVVLLAILLAAVSYFVDTPRETALKRSHELVDAFERADWATMTSILDPTAAVTVLNFPIYSNRDAIMTAAKKAHEQYGFKSVNVLTSSATQADTLITVNVFLLSEQDALGRTLNSEWQFEWQQTPDGWSLVEIRGLKIGQSTGDQIRNMFPGR